MIKNNTTTEDMEMNDVIDKLQSAITKLILDLKGDGTVEALAHKLNVSRNRLADILAPYQAPEEKKNRKKIGEEESSNSQGDKPKRLYWDLAPLIRIAYTLQISVSELIRAAEDVQDGLPPWFQMRITRGTKERTTKELVNVFLEAIGCRTYGPHDPLNVKGQRKMRNHYQRELMLKDNLEVFYSDIDISQMKFYALFLFEDLDLKKVFVKPYHEGKISSKDAYRILKEAVDLICSSFSLSHRKREKDSQRVQAIHLLEHFHKYTGHLVNAIISGKRDFLRAKSAKGKKTTVADN